MKITKPIIALLIGCLQALVIFSQTNKVISYLTANEKMVMKINPFSMAKKINWPEFIQSKMFAEMTKKSSDEMKGFLKNPHQTGIEINQGFFIVADNNKDSQPVLYGTLSDTAQFASFIRNEKADKKIVKTGNINLMIDKNTAVAWNQEIFVIATIKKAVSNPPDTKTNTPDGQADAKLLTEKCKSLLSKKTTAAHQQNFISLMQEDGDIITWSNNTLQSSSQKKSNKAQVVGMLNKNFMKNGNYTSAVINFENGKIIASMKQYVTASLDSLYQKYLIKNINVELLKKLPPGQPIFIYSFNVSPEMIKESFAKSGADKLIDSMAKSNINVRDIVSALKGDINFAIIKVAEPDKTDSITQAMFGLQFFLTGHINDKEKFKNIAAMFEETKEDSSNHKKKTKPFVEYNDSIFVLSVSPVVAQKFLPASNENADIEKLMSPYQNYPAAMILDLKTVFNIAMPFITKGKSEEESKKFAGSFNAFDKLISYGGRYDHGVVSTSVELTFSNKDENSLKQILEIANLLSSSDKNSSPKEN